jgi:hypothetical protein
MVSKRRCAQLGLISACLTLFTMLTVLFFGSYEFRNGQHRIGTAAHMPHDKDSATPHINVASVAK